MTTTTAIGQWQIWVKWRQITNLDRGNNVLYIYICCFITITKFLCLWSIINHLLSTAMKKLKIKYFGVTILILGVTWRHRNVTIGLGESTFLLVVNDDHASILHGYWDTGLQRFCGQEFDLLGSHDVIGHVTIGLGICGFLLVVHCNHASILHRYGNLKSQKYWGHDIDLLGSRDVIGQVTIGLGMCGFLLVVHWNHVSILHRYRDIKPQSCICPC